MTVSFIGGHFTKNGIGKDYPARVVLSIQGNGLDEQHQDTMVLFRDVTIINDGPPDLHTHPLRRTMEYAAYWYNQLRPIFLANNYRVNYFTITNELGGSDPEHIQDHIAFEENICSLAHDDDIKCAVGKLAGDSPTWGTGLWQKYYLPHIVKMWDEYGAVYARHVYGGNLVDSNGTPTNDPPGNPQRPFLEADILRSVGYTGGMVLAECGLDGGYGLADYDRFKKQALGYEAALKPYDDVIIGVCWWECGDTESWGSNYTHHLQTIKPLLDTTLPKWEGGQPNMGYKSVVVKIAQEHTRKEWETISGMAFADYKRTMTPSHDNAVVMVLDGNSESYVYIVDPSLQSQQEMIAICETLNITWKPLLLRDDSQPPSDEFHFTHWPTEFRVITQEFAANPDNYEQFGLPGHSGIDIRSPHGNKLFSVADGEVVRVEPVDNSNLGIQVRIKHKDDYETTHAHMQEIHVELGQSVSGGQVIGLSDNTGNSFGSHLHLMLKRFGHPYTDESGQLWPYDIQDPSPFLEVFDGITFQGKPWPTDETIPPTIPPPTGQQVDVHDYFVPSGQYGIYLVMDTGGSTQDMQLEKRADDVVLRKGDGNWIDDVKYQDSEQWKVEGGKVKKKIDTSDAGNDGKDGYDLHWATWIPQFVTVGTTYHSTPTVTRFNRTNCQVLSESQANDYLYIKEVIPSWTSPANNNIVISDVLVIEWRSGTSDLSKPPTETYYFAKNFGYVGWGDHFVKELPQGRAPLSGKLTDC